MSDDAFWAWDAPHWYAEYKSAEDDDGITLADRVDAMSAAHLVEDGHCSCGHPTPLHDNQAMAEAIVAASRRAGMNERVQ